MVSTLRHTILLVVLFCTISCGSVSDVSYLKKSGYALTPPSDVTIDFDEYVAQNKANIKAAMLNRQDPAVFQGNYDLEDAVDLRAPYSINIDSAVCPKGVAGEDKGFLLIHGLTDSPYLMKGLAQSLRKAYPCSIIRAIVLPGHSTIPGDANHSKDWDDANDHQLMTHKKWLESTNYGIRSFDKEEHVTSLYVLTFSTGAPLLINHVSKYEEPKLKGAVFISAAVKAKSKAAFLAPVAQYLVPWSVVYPEEDAVRYETFSTHAAAEFYWLTKDLLNDQYRFPLPLFVAISADDNTVSAEAALSYFCAAKTDNKKMIWYQYAKSEEPLDSFKLGRSACRDDIIEREIGKNGFELPSYYKSFSHTALSVPESDPHYGINGAYRQCKNYFMDDKLDLFTQCKDPKEHNYLIGETTKRFYNDNKGKLIRRGVYNPDYPFMEKQILSFIDSIN
ncbi:hypothetical protein D210916BOD24_18570 [Alteromonas sp. D210916BOD_24]|uniref:alpha/beta hydrolase n=1 Tax=Alteromonas sp. D210916BOD_24 TaxID=3157618 RepID=UPI00399C6144